MDHKTRGEITEAIVLSELVRRGVAVSTPFGENHRYDFVVEVAGDFYRLQCKTARHKSDRLLFQVSSTSPSNTGQTKDDYKGDVDYFVVHSKEESQTYLVPIDVVGTTVKTLRLEPTANNQSANVDMAANYTLDLQLNALRIQHGGDVAESA